MGFYWTTLLYQGRLLSQTAHDKLTKAKGELDSAFLTKVTKDRWILHAPGMCLTMGSVDPVLEDSEKDAGRVSRSEIERWLKDKETKREKYGLEPRCGPLLPQSRCRGCKITYQMLQQMTTKTQQLACTFARSPGRPSTFRKIVVRR